MEEPARTKILRSHFPAWALREGHRDREQAILEAHFPLAPNDRYDAAEGGRAFEKVDSSLVGSLLGKASSTSAPGSDCISAGIVKEFWRWDPARFTQLV